MEATDVSVYNFNSQLSCSLGRQMLKQVTRGGKNEEKERVDCNYGSLWNSGCLFFSAEEGVGAELEPGVVGQ